MGDKKETPRIVFMVNDTMITFTDGSINEEAMEHIALLLSNIHNSGKNVALVSAGAIVLGSATLETKTRPNSLSEKQALAAIGQVEMMKLYQKHFNDFNQIVAQVLVTRNVILEKGRIERASATMKELFKMDIIPIINENDSVSTADIELEDNYPLTSNIATLIDADLLIIASDIHERYSLIQKNSVQAKVVNSDDELFNCMEEMLNNKILQTTSENSFPQFLHEIQFPDE